MSRNRSRLGAGLAIAGLAATLISIRIPLHASATLEVVASGLANPRGLNFGPEGGLYVAEAGTGGIAPCIINSNNQFVCYGETGAITRITRNRVEARNRKPRSPSSDARTWGSPRCSIGSCGKSVPS